MTELQAGWTSYSEYRMRFEGEEQRERQEWERTRWMAFLMMQMHPYIKTHQKPGTPMAWLPFPWEKESIQAPEGGWGVTEEESNELNAMLKAFIEKNKNKATS